MDPELIRRILAAYGYAGDNLRALRGTASDPARGMREGWGYDPRENFRRAMGRPNVTIGDPQPVLQPKVTIGGVQGTPLSPQLSPPIAPGGSPMQPVAPSSPPFGGPMRAPQQTVGQPMPQISPGPSPMQPVAPAQLPFGGRRSPAVNMAPTPTNPNLFRGMTFDEYAGVGGQGPQLPGGSSGAPREAAMGGNSGNPRTRPQPQRGTARQGGISEILEKIRGSRPSGMQQNVQGPQMPVGTTQPLSAQASLAPFMPDAPQEDGPSFLSRVAGAGGSFLDSLIGAPTAEEAERLGLSDDEVRRMKRDAWITSGLQTIANGTAWHPYGYAPSAMENVAGGLATGRAVMQGPLEERRAYELDRERMGREFRESLEQDEQVYQIGLKRQSKEEQRKLDQMLGSFREAGLGETAEERQAMAVLAQAQLVGGAAGQAMAQQAAGELFADDDDQYETLTPQESVAAGFRPGTVVQRRTRDGALIPIQEGLTPSQMGVGGGRQGLSGVQGQFLSRREEEATAAHSAIQSTQTALEAVRSDPENFGPGADYRRALRRTAMALGVANPETKEAEDTAERYMLSTMQMVPSVIRAFGSGTGLSDADREFALKMIYGDLKLSPENIERALELRLKVDRATANAYSVYRQQYLDSDPGKTLWEIVDDMEGQGPAVTQDAAKEREFTEAMRAYDDGDDSALKAFGAKYYGVNSEAREVIPRSVLEDPAAAFDRIRARPGG